MPVRKQLEVIALLGVAVSGCGGNSSTTTTTTSNAGPAPATTRAAPSTAASAPTSARRAKGPGRLLATPLVYRNRSFVPGKHLNDPLNPRYTAYLRTAGAFVTHDDVGTTVPGEIDVDDGFDNHDGYSGAIGNSTIAGKCYRWDLQTPSPHLDTKHIGDKVTVLLKLPRTAPQTRIAILRRQPTSESSLDAALRTTGCQITP